MVRPESEEVNLLDVLAAFFAALKRNYILSIAVPLIGIAVAVVIASGSRDMYESSLLLETSLLSESESTFLLEELEKFGIIPGLSVEEDKQVKSLKFKVIKNESNPAYSLNEKSLYLQVTARVYKKEILPALEKAIIQFINTSAPVVRHRAERQKFYEGLIAKIEGEIRAMDEVKREINSKVQATYLDPSQLYAETITLYREKMTLEIKRDEIKQVHLIKGFDSLTIDRKPNLVLMAALGFIAGFVVLCFILFVQFFATYFKHYRSTHPSDS
jgi:hypothetical protein